MDSEKQSEGFEGAGVGGWGNQVVGIREGTDCMEHWVWCKNKEYFYAEKIKIKKEVYEEGKHDIAIYKQQNNNNNKRSVRS